MKISLHCYSKDIYVAVIVSQVFIFFYCSTVGIALSLDAVTYCFVRYLVANAFSFFMSLDVSKIVNPWKEVMIRFCPSAFNFW